MIDRTEGEFSAKVIWPYARTDPVLVVLSGELELSTAPKLAQRLSALCLHTGLRVRADMSKVTFLDATGIRALVVGARDIRDRQGELTIFGMIPAVRRTAEIAQLSSFVSIE